jgi:dTDP-6-deoxy-L-talose 4-dehydrogenase (NAD+)
VRVVVTGAAGFIGASATRGLVAQGHTVLGILRGTSSTTRIKELIPRMEVLSADLDDDRAVGPALRAFRPDAALHLAWYAKPQDYLHSPANLASLATTLRFFEQCRAAGCRRFVGLGTCLEYADSPERRTEADPTDPMSLYASAKLSAFHLLRAVAARDQIGFAWARLFHIHGRGESEGRLLAAIAHSLREGRVFNLTSGEQVRDHLDVEDVGGALACLVSSSAAGPFNVCSGTPVSLREVTTTLAEALGRSDLLQFGAIPMDPTSPRFLVGDPSRLLALGWRPKRQSLRASLIAAYEGSL